MAGPFDDILIIDLTRVLSGPYCTMILADLGARVIKIEEPARGDDTRAWGPPFVDGESAYFLSVNRNKQSVTLNLKDERGRALLRRLIARGDVLAENFRPGVLDRLGVGYDAVRAINPRIIYGSISGFGQTGPSAARPGYDAIVQAEGGLMSITGMADGPAVRLGVAIADLVAGMYAAQGISAALYVREHTGLGQHVDIGMLDAVASLLTYQAGSYFATGRVPGRLGNRHLTIAPYETFQVRDGDLVVAVGNNAQWVRFCEAIGRPELAADPRFTTNEARVVQYEELRPLLAAALAGRTRAEWIAALERAGVPCGTVRSLDEVFRDPQLGAREMVVQLDHATVGPIRVTGNPVKLSATPGAVRTPPPRLGEHNAAVYGELLGLSEGELRELRDAGVI